MGFRLELTEERKKLLSTELDRLITGALRDRSQLEREWAENDDLYNSKVDPAKTQQPFPGASAFNVPLIETYVNAVSGRLTDSIHGQEPTFTVRNRTTQWLETSKAAEDWIEYRMRETIKLRNVSEQFNFSMCKHGTAFMYAPWEVLLDKRLRYDVEQDDVEMTVDSIIAGPMVDVPMIHDILVPKEAATMQVSPWIAQRFRLTEDDLQVRAFSGKYDKASVDEAIKFTNEHPDDITRQKTEDAGFAPSTFAPFHEIWQWMGLFKLPNHKHPTWFIVPYHYKSRQPLSLLVNFYPHQFRPYFHANFQRTDSGVYGRGVCRMARSGNIEVNDLHKHRVDNAFICNTRFYKVKSGWLAQMPKRFRIWPGRLVPVGSQDDISSEAMADIYGSTLEAELVTTRTMERLVGLSDFSLSSGGGEGLKRVGATTALTAVQESGRVINSRLNHVRMTYAELASWVIEMDAYFRPLDEIVHVLGPKGATALMQLFDAPPAVVRGNMAIELTASSATMNREMDKQSDILLVNIMSQYLNRFMELGLLIANPETPEPLKVLGVKIANVVNELMRDVLRDFDKRNSSLILSEFEDVFRGNGSQDQSGLPGVNPQTAGTESGLAAAAAKRDGLGDEVRSLGTLLGVE